MRRRPMIIPKLSVEFQKSPADNDDAGYPINVLSLYNHQVIVDGFPAETHFEGDHYYWRRINEQSQEEHGVLKLFSHGLMGSGVITAEGRTLPFTANAMISYAFTVEQKTWINFEMGFVVDDKGQKHAFGKFTIPNDPKGSEMFNQKTTTVFSIIQDKDSHDVLHVHFDVDPTFCSYGFCSWIAGDFNFTLDYSRCKGEVYEFDVNASDYHGPKHDLTGIYTDSEFITELKSAVQEFYANQCADGPVLKSVPAVFPPNLLKANALAAEINNSVEDLYTLPAPDMENLHELSFAKLKSLMLYAIDDNWRGWFGEKKPDVGPNGPLTQSDVDLLSDVAIKTFLTDRFAVGYLTQVFSQSEEENIKKMFEGLSGCGDKLNYFWKGSADQCFGGDKGYNLATSGLMDGTFVSCVPGFSKYLADNPAEWAKKLYDYCVQPFTLNGLALQNTLDGRKRLTHLCTMLHCLDHEARLDADEGKKITYATSLYCRVMDVRLNFVMSRFSPDHKEEGVAFLTEFFKQYFASILAGGKWQEDVLRAAKADLEELMKEYQVDNVNQLVNKLGDVIADTMDVFIKLKDLPLPQRINTWAQNHPKLSKALGRTMTVAFYGFSIMSTIMAFMDWGELKPEEKVQAVVDTVAVAVSIFSDVSKFAAASKLSTAQTSITEVMQAGDEITNAVKLESATRIAGRLGVKLDVQLARLGAPALGRAGQVAGEGLARAGSLAETAGKWLRFSRIAGAFATGMTILALGAACVSIGFEIANDLSTGQSVAMICLDIIEEVATGVAFLVEAGAGIAALAGATVCSVIPVIGIVAAVVGIVAAIVTLCIHRKQPPTPEEKFVTDHCLPFINGLDSPSSEWLETQKKVTDHLVKDTSPSLAFAWAN